MSLTRLDYDTLSQIISYVHSTQTVLYLDLTCRAMRHAVIPFLFRRVSCRSLKHLYAVERTIVAEDSLAGAAVRHLKLALDLTGGSGQAACFTKAASRIIERSKDLLSLLVIDFPVYEPRLLRAVGSLAQLHRLEMRNCGSLEQLRGLGGLVHLKIHASNDSISVTSGLWDIVLNSRDTLQELVVIGNAQWNLQSPSDPFAPSADGTVCVWPHLHTLRIPNTTLRGHPNLVASFPSARCLALSAAQTRKLEKTPDYYILSRLELIEGNLGLVKLALAAGANPRRIVVAESLSAEDVSQISKRLPPSVRSLHLHFGEKPPPECFEQLTNNAPNITFLSFSLVLGRHIRNLTSTMKNIMRAVSCLPLSYLRVSVTVDRSRGNRLVGGRDFLQSFPGSQFLPLAIASFPELRVVSLDWTTSYSYWYPKRLDWKKTMGNGPGAFGRISEEDGIRWMERYDWERDESL
ncbi:hypothetical protein BOTBODRAFT_184700 [Botryobasidium botryosum FD-172 SS1]|uniref:F-box domain-containing protein n=1 Tax=Botryobasidium botryosum (strain FD-172 SS1) TaxID=930990 RepID=A0A067MT04_BOTB1|nr:hypothetical protein BOTBODRAFT_184700 [Botryobasidium botryosum FD-172 SS1]